MKTPTLEMFLAVDPVLSFTESHKGSMTYVWFYKEKKFIFEVNEYRYTFESTERLVDLVQCDNWIIKDDQGVRIAESYAE